MKYAVGNGFIFCITHLFSTFSALKQKWKNKSGKDESLQPSITIKWKLKYWRRANFSSLVQQLGRNTHYTVLKNLSTNKIQVLVSATLWSHSHRWVFFLPALWNRTSTHFLKVCFHFPVFVKHSCAVLAPAGLLLWHPVILRDGTMIMQL